MIHRYQSTLIALSWAVVIWAAPAQAGDDAAAGEAVFGSTCAGCHSLEPGVIGVGPSLAGIFGATAGSAAGYGYTDAMANSGVVWDETALDAHLLAPAQFIPGNRMGQFLPGGVPDDMDRGDIIAFLKSLGG